MELKLFQDGIQFEHSRAVSKISGRLAKQMGYPPDEIAIIEQVALYHDTADIVICGASFWTSRKTATISAKLLWRLLLTVSIPRNSMIIG